MQTTRAAPPEHVCAAFGARPEQLEPLPGGSVWRCGGVVLKPVGDRARAVWTAETMGRVRTPELRIASPVRATDGRWLIGGWSAARYLSGTAEYRADAVLLASLRLHDATRSVRRPDFLAGREDVDALADRMAWEDTDVSLDEHKGGRWFDVLAGARRPVRLRNQLVHGDLFGHVLFDANEPPGIVDFSPYFRPAEWAAAVVAVDALAWGGAESELLHRWSHLPEWPQMLLRATLFRLAAHALNPRSTRAALDGLLDAAHEVSELL